MRKPEFSKIVLSAAVITWLAGAVFGGYIVNEERSQLGELLTYIGAPAATAFGFYAWKAKAENVIKIPKMLEKLEKEKLPKSTKERVIKMLSHFFSSVSEEDFDNADQ